MNLPFTEFSSTCFLPGDKGDAFINNSSLAQQTDYCSLTRQHTLCRYSSDTAGSSCKKPLALGVDPAQREEILQIHNRLRSRVATGQETRGNPGPQPTASSMLELLWDPELAEIAQAWANQCTFQHDCGICRQTGRFVVGQNIFISGGTAPSNPNWEGALGAFYEEVIYMNRQEVLSFAGSRGVGHYTQMVWGSTQYVGCGFIQYQDGSFIQNFHVCNYGAAGNFIGRSIYDVGQPCSRCPSGTVCSGRYTGLCSPSDPGDSPRPGDNGGGGGTSTTPTVPTDSPGGNPTGSTPAMPGYPTMGPPGFNGTGFPVTPGPGIFGSPGQPGSGGIPGRPGSGGVPGRPGSGVIPGRPGSGGIPGRPGSGGIPGRPGFGNIPGTTGFPGSPGNPLFPGRPGIGTNPGNTGIPGFGNIPGTSGFPGLGEIPGINRPPGIGQGPGISGNPDRPGNTGLPGTFVFPGFPGIGSPGIFGRPGFPGAVGDNGSQESSGQDTSGQLTPAGGTGSTGSQGGIGSVSPESSGPVGPDILPQNYLPPKPDDDRACGCEILNRFTVSNERQILIMIC